jgi:hypothetical protein
MVATVNGIEYEIGDEVSYANLHWSSDWNGDEVGFDDVLVVGLYSFADAPHIYIYLDTENGTILDMWEEEEE